MNENNHNEKDPYDIAYEWGWSHPKLKETVYLCYKTPNFAENARRFYHSQEFRAELELLKSFDKSPSKDIHILDFACGNGIACYCLSKKGYSVTGKDSSLGYLAGLNAARKIQGLDNITFNLELVSLDKFELGEEEYDIIWVREALHHITDLNIFFKHQYFSCYSYLLFIFLITFYTFSCLMPFFMFLCTFIFYLFLILFSKKT